MTVRLFLLLLATATLSCTAEAPHLASRAFDPAEELRVPDDLWARVCGRAGFAGTAMGRTDAEMRNYPPTEHVLRRLRLAFDDVRYAPRLAGSVADALLEASPSRGRLTSAAFGLLDVLVRPDMNASRASGDAGGMPWAPEREPSPEERAGWERLPEPLRRLAARLFVGAAEAAVWVRAALPESVLSGNRAALHSLARAPWGDPATDLPALPVPRGSRALPDETDLAAIGYAASLFSGHVDLALAEFRTLSGKDPLPPEIGPLLLETPLGPIRIGSSGNDVHPGGDFLVIDPGGDDLYTGTNAASGPGRPVSMVLDLAGNDRYEGGEDPGSLAYGLFGIGLLVDAEGDDAYRHRAMGLGASCYGFGGLFDLAGDDVYETTGSDGQGAGLMGVGILADLAGNDRYVCATQSQGFALTRGVGILLDVSGNDDYRAAGPKRPDLSFRENPLSMAQGCGFGIRGDSSDGRHLAGGIGILVDGSGDDAYRSGCYSGGAGYWWAMGIFVDCAGNDVHDRSLYSLGASPHFGVGVCIDRAGDDRYNPESASGRLALGAGRDGGLGWFIDGDGDDRYWVPAACGGASSLNGFGIFWDRRGEDIYQAMPDTKPREKHGGKPILAFGYAGGEDRKLEKKSGFTDDLMGVGAFLDTGGKDAYLQPSSGPATHQAADGGEWIHARGRDRAGMGWDVELYR